MKKLLAVLLLLYPLGAAAETYQWTDERGTVNFADDLGQVPKKYRKKAKPLGAEEEAAPAPKTGNGSEGEPAKPKSKTGEQGAKKLYGGKDEEAWRRDFRQTEFNLKNAESELATLRGRIADTSRMSRTEYLSVQNSIKYAEDRVRLMQNKLDELRETADRLGVPPDFRK